MTGSIVILRELAVARRNTCKATCNATVASSTHVPIGPAVYVSVESVALILRLSRPKEIYPIRIFLRGDMELTIADVRVRCMPVLKCLISDYKRGTRYTACSLLHSNIAVL